MDHSKEKTKSPGPDLANVFINTSTVKETFTRSNSEVSLRSVSTVSSDADAFKTPSSSRASTPVMADQEEDKNPLSSETLQEKLRSLTPEVRNEDNFQHKGFFGPKTLSVMASIASITCVVLANTLKLASHTHLGLIIAAAVLLTLAFSLMINELVATTRGRHFLTK